MIYVYAMLGCIASFFVGLAVGFFLQYVDAKSEKDQFTKYSLQNNKRNNYVLRPENLLAE